jgi:elongator complex protein 1
MAPEPDQVETIVSFRYLSNSGTICCILGGGDIVLVKVERDAHEEQVDIIGNIEGGVLAAEWTVDEEVLAIASSRSLSSCLQQNIQNSSS